jgi:hypothetical protein
MPEPASPKTTKSFTDLIYGGREVEMWFKEHWPHVKLASASDYIHPERFEVGISGVDADEVYPLMMADGWFTLSLTGQMAMHAPDTWDARFTAKDVRRWVEKAKTLPEWAVSRDADATTRLASNARGKGGS